MLPRVAVIYLSYNSKHYLDEVFSSLLQLNYPKDKLEIIAVDNNSSDGCADWLRAREDIVFFPCAKNFGFAEANNLAIKHALLEGFDYVYLLNADAKLHPGAIMEAVKLAESDRLIGAVQSRIMLWKKPDVVNVTGGMVHFLGFGFARDNGKLWDGRDGIKSRYVETGLRFKKSKKRDPATKIEVAYASGAAVLYRSSVLRKVGLLEPFYFMYHEDLELGWRIRLAGFKNVFSVDSIAYHDYEFKRSIQKFYWMERNRVIAHFSHLRLRSLLVLAPCMLLAEFGLVLFAIKGGWIREKFLVYVDLFSPKTRKHIARKRRESRLIRRVSDREIVRLWTGKIEHQETSSLVVDAILNPLLQFTWFIIHRLIR